MDDRSQKFLEEILKKNPNELTEDQIKFLKARVFYLKDSQVEEYASVLTSDKEPVNKNAKKQTN